MTVAAAAQNICAGGASSFVTKNYTSGVMIRVAACRFWTSGEGPMDPVSGIAPNGATNDQSSAAAFSAPSASTDASSNGTSGPSVTVDLSENAKAALAAANQNQDAANRILAFVDANRSGRSRRHSSRDWSDGEPNLQQEYQQLTGNLPQNPNGQQPSQGDVLDITLTESTSANLSVESGSGARAISASAASTQYNSISLSVNVSTGSIQIVQSDQSQTETTAQTGSASPLSITA